MVTSQVLSQANIFEGLTEAQLQKIGDISEEVTCQHGEVLFWEGDPADWLYILLEGEINIFVKLSSRPERVTLSVLNQPYQALAWSGLVAPNVYSASALCESDCRLLEIDGQALMELLEQDKEMGFAVMCRIAELISGRMRNTRFALLKTL